MYELWATEVGAAYRYVHKQMEEVGLDWTPEEHEMDLMLILAEATPMLLLASIVEMFTNEDLADSSGETLRQSTHYLMLRAPGLTKEEQLNQIQGLPPTIIPKGAIQELTL